MAWDSESEATRATSANSAVSVSTAPRSTPRRTGVSAARPRRAADRSLAEVTGRSSTDWITSPGWSPASQPCDPTQTLEIAAPVSPRKSSTSTPRVTDVAAGSAIEGGGCLGSKTPVTTPTTGSARKTATPTRRPARRVLRTTSGLSGRDAPQALHDPDSSQHAEWCRAKQPPQTTFSVSASRTTSSWQKGQRFALTRTPSAKARGGEG